MWNLAVVDGMLVVSKGVGQRTGVQLKAKLLQQLSSPSRLVVEQAIALLWNVFVIRMGFSPCSQQ